MMNRILDFLKLRYAFVIRTDADTNAIKKKLFDRFEIDSSFINLVVSKNSFAFSHVDFFPELYNFSPISFEGEIRQNQKTCVKIISSCHQLYLWLFVVGILGTYILYFANIGGFQEKFYNSPFPLNPIFAVLLILIPYGHYAKKLYTIKGVVKSVIRNEEKLQSA